MLVSSILLSISFTAAADPHCQHVLMWLTQPGTRDVMTLSRPQSGGCLKPLNLAWSKQRWFRYAPKGTRTGGQRLDCVIQQVDGIRLQEMAEAVVQLPKAALLSCHPLPSLPMRWYVPEMLCMHSRHPRLVVL